MTGWCSLRTDQQLLVDILEAADAIAAFLEGFDQDRFLTSPLQQSAVVYQLLIIGEAASKISQDLRTCHPNIEWRGAIKSRAVMAHDYAALVMPLIWHTATESVPLFRQKVYKMLKTEFPQAFQPDGSIE